MVAEIVLDIETGNPTKEALEIERLTIKPDGRSTTEEGKKRSREKKLKEGGLLNLAPIDCIGTILDGIHVNFNCFSMSFQQQKLLLDDGIFSLSFGTEKEMLENFSRMFDSLADDQTVLISHNGISFDTAKIRTRCAYYGIQGAALFAPQNRHNHYDTQVRFGWSFAHRGDEQKYVSLERICASLGVDFSKEGLSGSEVPDAIDNQEYVAVVLYNQRDCTATREAAHRMMLQGAWQPYDRRRV